MTACLSQSYPDYWMSLCPSVCRSGLFLVSVCICLSLGLSLSAISIPVSVITDKTAEQKCNWFLSPSLCRYRRCLWIVPLVSLTVSEIRQADRKAYIRQSFWSANKTNLLGLLDTKSITVDWNVGILLHVRYTLWQGASILLSQWRISPISEHLSQNFPDWSFLKNNSLFTH